MWILAKCFPSNNPSLFSETQYHKVRLNDTKEKVIEKAKEITADQKKKAITLNFGFVLTTKRKTK